MPAMIRNAIEDLASLAALSGFIFMVLVWADYLTRAA